MLGGVGVIIAVGLGGLELVGGAMLHSQLYILRIKDLWDSFFLFLHWVVVGFLVLTSGLVIWMMHNGSSHYLQYMLNVICILRQ